MHLCARSCEKFSILHSDTVKVREKWIPTLSFRKLPHNFLIKGFLGEFFGNICYVIIIEPCGCYNRVSRFTRKSRSYKDTLVHGASFHYKRKAKKRLFSKKTYLGERLVIEKK